MTLDLDELERLRAEAVTADGTVTYLCALLNRADALLAAARERDRLASSLESTKAILNELHEYVAQMCERFGDKRDEVPCDAWRLRDNILKTERQAEALRADRDRLAERVARCEAVLARFAAHQCDAYCDVHGCSLPADVRNWEALASAERSEPQLPRVTPEGIVLRPASDYYDTSTPDSGYVPGPRMPEQLRATAHVRQPEPQTGEAERCGHMMWGDSERCALCELETIESTDRPTPSEGR